MKNLHGFKYIRKVELNEISANLHEMEHINTGLKLIWLERDDINKSFAITFTTLPEDDTGVFHILEHSVLSGSKRYPVKEPFLELMKSSLNTFLNAMTYPDKTVYPISSRNDADFINLTRVYLDAVFCPSLYTKPEIFHQEGWHYEFDDDDNLTYKGVVFNEMKGAFADPDETELIAMNRMLFPDSPYRFVSGGDPSAIPNLSYDEFVRTHERFYSPSNAFVFLDGAINIVEMLKIINDEYLVGKEKRKRIAPPIMQKAVDGGTSSVLYEIGPEEEKSDKFRLALGCVAGRFDERVKMTALSILSDVLCGTNSSPLKKVILENGLAEDVSLSLMDEIAQPILALEIRNLKKDNIEKAEKMIVDKLHDLAINGLDHDQILATMAHAEFKMRERDSGSFPIGLAYGLNIIGNWLYEGVPEANLEVGTLFEELKANLSNGYFERLINDIILRNPHRCRVIMEPSTLIGEQRRAGEEQRLSSIKANMSEQQSKRIKQEQQTLEDWHNSEDTPELLATLPHLTLADIQDMPEDLPCEVETINGIRVLKHTLASNGIEYVTLYFDAKNLTEEEISTLSFITSLFSQIDTEDSSSEEIARKARLYCGNLDFGVSILEDNNAKSTVRLTASFSTLSRNLNNAVKLVLEILTRTKLIDEKPIFDIIKQNKQELFQGIVMSGHSIGMRRVNAMFTPGGVMEDCASGFAYYEWTKKQESEWNWSQLRLKISDLIKRIISQDNLTISVTSEDTSIINSIVSTVQTNLIKNAITSEYYQVKARGKAVEGIIIPADVSFAVRGGSYKEYGGEYQGCYPLIAKVESLAYLWNVIRVNGGAYGTGMLIRDNGMTACYSYRDPSGAQSLELYCNCEEFLKSFSKNSQDLIGFIVGTVSDSSPLLSVKMKGNIADSFYFRGVTYESRCKRRRELLNSSMNELISAVDSINKAIVNGGICIVGSEEQVKAYEIENTYFI